MEDFIQKTAELANCLEKCKGTFKNWKELYDTLDGSNSSTVFRNCSMVESSTTHDMISSTLSFITETIKECEFNLENLDDDEMNEKTPPKSLDPLPLSKSLSNLLTVVNVNKDDEENQDENGESGESEDQHTGGIFYDTFVVNKENDVDDDINKLDDINKVDEEEEEESSTLLSLSDGYSAQQERRRKKRRKGAGFF
jgi:hypothetical protein